MKRADTARVFAMKGQVTFFIILSIVVAFLVITAFYFRDELRSQAMEVAVGGDVAFSLDLKTLNTNVKECVGTVGSAALYFLGLQGGNIGRVEPSVKYSGLDVPYFYYKGEKNIPSNKKMEGEVARYIKSYLPRCVTFPEGYSVDAGEVEPEVSIKKGTVEIDVKWPIILSKGEVKGELENFDAEIKVRTSDILLMANAIVVDQIRHNDELCIDCIVNVAVKNGVNIRLNNEGKDVVLTVVDPQFKLLDGPYFFRFAFKF